MDTFHRYEATWDLDGDYVILAAFCNGRWKTCARWMIPGTWMED